MSTSRRLLQIMLLMATGTSLPAQPNRRALDSVVARAAAVMMADRSVTGLSIGIATRDGDKTYAFGETARGNHTLPTPQTFYAIGSITKTITATLLAQAVVEGRVRLDDDVRNYLHGEYPNLAYGGVPIRLAHLISHLSRLPRELPYTRSDFYRDLHTVVIDTVPGLRFQYSNAAAQLLGYILEERYGMPYEQLFAEKIGVPLGMPDTRMSLTPSDERRMAQGYDSSGVVSTTRFDQLQAAGGLKSTLSDMLRYARWQMSERDSAVRLTRTPQFTYGQYGVGLNWQFMTGAGSRTVWQDGGLPGYSSLLVVVPDLHIGVVVLANGVNHVSGTYALANGILSALDQRATLLP